MTDLVENTLTEVSLLHRMTNRIRQSLELNNILSATVAEMRSFLKTDRVKIYRFEEDGTGVVMAEAVYQDRLPSLKGLHFPAGDIPPQVREMFVKARQRTIVNVATQQMLLNREGCPDTTGDLTVEDLHEHSIGDILQRPVDPCHIEYLTAMGVQSSLVVPILDRQTLWGLLISHHSQPKDFSLKDLEIVQSVADQVSVAIAQSNLLSQAKAKAKWEALVNNISTLLHSPMSVQQMLQTVLEKLVKAVRGSGGRLYLISDDASTASTELYTYGSQPNLAHREAPYLEWYPFWQEMREIESLSLQESAAKTVRSELSYSQSIVDSDSASLLQQTASTIQVVKDIYQHPQLTSLQSAFRETKIRGLLVMPLRYAQHLLGFLTIFRDERNTDIVWAGRFNPDERQQRVRDSFEAWREQKKGQTPPWKSEEIELLESLGIHLSMAMMQNRLYQWEKEHRLLVEMRNRELETARAVAEEANQLKSDFLSSTSHELRTPLSSTLNYLRLLKEGFYESQEELQEFIQIAYRSAENLTNIINEVLDIAKIESGRMQVNWEWVNLTALLEEKRNLFKIQSRRKGVDLIVESNVKTVWADEVKLRQVFTNLLSNAFKFTDKGEVRIRAQLLPSASENAVSRVEISVADTGIGLDASKQNQLFEAFVQANGSVRRRYGGTGLGLTICKRIVELMGGKIRLESPGAGKGTTVIFTVLAEPPASIDRRIN